MPESEEKLNCHYVTRFLTREWEYSGGSLKYFNFETGQVHRGYSNRLFSQEGTNTGEIEGLLSKYIETPLARYKNEHLGDPSDVTNISDWSVFRALYLYFFAQTLRYGKAILSTERPDSGEKLEELLKKPEIELNTMIWHLKDRYKLVTLQTPPGKFLFFPEVGFFQFPVEDAGCVTGWTFGHAFPITPHFCVATVSPTVTEEKLQIARTQLEAYSTGLNELCARVLIPAEILPHADDARIKEVLTDYRKRTRESASAIQKIRELVVEMYGKVGLPLEHKPWPDGTPVGSFSHEQALTLVDNKQPMEVSEKGGAKQEHATDKPGK